MNCLVNNRAHFHNRIDFTYDARTSIVLRYRNALSLGGTEEEDNEYRAWLKRTSIREGARILPLLHYNGVELFILDETSLMHTKTIKSIDGCVTIAHCKQRNYQRVVFESGGNTGTAFTAYGQRMGIETYCFLPEENIPLLKSTIFKPDTAHLIAVKDPGLVKKAARLFGKARDLSHIPQTSWRCDASLLRGFFIVEHMLGQGRVDWFTQTISAAFGPIGIYRVFGRFKKELGGSPRFLGVQQEANCPFYRAWKLKDHEPEPTELHSTRQLLTRVMYDGKPRSYGTYQRLARILDRTRGDMTTVNHSEFAHLFEKRFGGKGILDLLKDNGITITLKDGEVVEKTGLIALAGTLKAIKGGIISPGSKVLCSLSSGVSEADGRAQPEYRLSSLADIPKQRARRWDS